MTLDLIAKYYDILHGEMEEDVPMWLALAHKVPGPILEVGCGTGRLLEPLAQAGHDLVGIDLSEVALNAARTRLATAGLADQVSISWADMRDFDLFRQDFVLAFLPLNTFMHCHTVEDQLAALRAIHKHLRPGGYLVIDLFYPDPVMLAEVDGRLYLEAETVDDVSGHVRQWYWRHDIDLADQMRHLTYILDEIDSEGMVRRTTIPVSLRFVYRFEMELLLKAAGFLVEMIYGTYAMDPFDGDSPRMIFVAEKKTNRTLHAD